MPDSFKIYWDSTTFVDLVFCSFTVSSIKELFRPGMKLNMAAVGDTGRVFLNSLYD
jgi:hypothetical protein